MEKTKEAEYLKIIVEKLNSIDLMNNRISSLEKEVKDLKNIIKNILKEQQ